LAHLDNLNVFETGLAYAVRTKPGCLHATLRGHISSSSIECARELFKRSKDS